ncbi:MAG: hypothetical protein IT318_23740 [Anaerolineales bacterium]|nr:hypothetical protein [Anaerolineales bacterium]
MKLVGPLNTGLTTGGAGVSTANASTTVPVCGYVMGIYVKYNGAPPVTADVIVKTVGTSPRPPSLTLLSLADTQVDGWRWPRVPTHKASDGTAIADQYDWPAIDDLVNVALSQADDGDSADVWLLVDG